MLFWDVNNEFQEEKLGAMKEQFCNKRAMESNLY
jgi:hypothetical protein